MAFNIEQQSYKDLRSVLTERTSSVVAWVGSGMSADAGLPTWAQLRKKLVSVLRQNAATFEKKDREKKEAAATYAEKQDNLWIAFQVLHEELGSASWHDVIRNELRVAPKTEPPEAYRSLWKLGIRGLLNLNLDRLATRAFHQTQRDVLPVEGSGFQIANFAHVLKSPDPFIANLHGTSEDVSSWVLTQKQLNALSGRAEYQQFIAGCLTTRIVLFIGITADDMGVGGHLDKLNQLSPSTGGHYWITHRRDDQTNRWAEERHLRLIRYTANGSDHSELNELFDNLLAYRPSDDVPPPVVLSTTQRIQKSLLEPEQLVKEDAENIREVLNKHAQTILVNENDSDYEKYDDFCKRYDQAIYRAWYTSTVEGLNQLFQYTLHGYVAKGGFGTVYRATDRNGGQVAVKVLNQEIRQDARMLQSFRRGVRSMRILSKHRLLGMVPYIDATEIPAVVVMDWVEGPNLKDAVVSHYVDDWKARLHVAVALAEIIRKAHSLPERVLHRDIRPANIMLEGYYTDPADFNIVVLDFDLSWHQGAAERSVVYGATTTGYLAPEQLQNSPGVTTRHAAVDSFGIGMTMYFMVAQRDPYPTQHEHGSWSQDVLDCCNRWPFPEWVSLPARYARLIIHSTKWRQSERWDMSQICGELSRLFSALKDPSDVEWADMLAEEVVARSNYGRQYRWYEDKRKASVELPSGLAVNISGDEANARLNLKLSWISSGFHSHKQIIKWLPDRGDKVQKILKGAGWEITNNSSWSEEVNFEALISVATARKTTKKIVDALNLACHELSFD